MAVEKYSLEGVDELVNALKSLPVDLQNKILKGFLRKVGNKFIVNPLKAKVPYSQKSKKTIKVTAGNKNETNVSAGVGRSGFKLRWAELGTVERKTKKGANRGRIQGRNIIQPHIEGEINNIVDYVNDELGNEIQKTLERRLKKLHMK